MLTYKEFLNESYEDDDTNSAFNDIRYYNQAGQKIFNTRDQVTIDFLHLLDSYYNYAQLTLEKRLEKFNNFYKTNITLEQAKIAIPIIEEHWPGETDLDIETIKYAFDNPDKIEDLFKSKNIIDKYNI